MNTNSYNIDRLHTCIKRKCDWLIFFYDFFTRGSVDKIIEGYESLLSSMILAHMKESI